MNSFSYGVLVARQGGWDTVTFQNVPDRLVGNVVPEVREPANDSVVTPIAVLVGHEDDQRFNLRADSQPSLIRAILGSIELAGDQATIPAENRLGLRDRGELGEELVAEKVCAARSRR